MYRALAMFQEPCWCFVCVTSTRTIRGQFYNPILITTEKNEVLRN